MKLTVYGEQASRGIELEIVFTRFVSELWKADPALAEKVMEKIGKLRHTDILVCLPYWLTEALQRKLPLNTIRALALGNLFGTVCILAQDRVIDSQQDLLKDFGEVQALLLANEFYYKWIKEYQRVFPSHTYFWPLFEKYLREYTRSVIWEKREHWGKLSDFAESDFRSLGQKLSPLKMCCAAMCLLNERKDIIPILSNLVEEYHIGYQLADDVGDWREDLRSRNFTYFLTRIHRFACAEDLTESEVDSIIRTSSLLKETLEIGAEHYRRAQRLARDLACPSLVAYIEELLGRNDSLESGRLQMPAVARIDIAEPSREYVAEEMHTFRVNEQPFIVGVRRHQAIRVDAATGRIAGKLSAGRSCSALSLKASCPEIPISELAEILSELEAAGLLLSAESASRADEEIEVESSQAVVKRTEAIIAVGLQAWEEDGDRNRLMSFETARNGINLLFRHGAKLLESYVYFFLNGDLTPEARTLLERSRDYAEKVAHKLNKRLRFSVVCIGAMHAGDARTTVDRLCERGVGNLLLVPRHANGTAESAHAGHSFGSGGNGSIGIDANTWRLIDRLKSTTRYRYFCNAGKSYVVVAPSGCAYPCHKFAESKMLAMGNVEHWSGFEQGVFIDARLGSVEKCHACWARNLCGGSCLYLSLQANGSMTDPDDRWCEYFRNELETSAAKWFSLSREDQEELQEHAKSDFRPCDIC